jgi:hypothetical protein
MKKSITGICFFILLAVLAVGSFSIAPANAETDSDYLFSSQSNNTWILQKSTRKMILVSFEKNDNIWKSEVITIPDVFDLGKCIITAVGMRGTSVFLFDKSSSLITLFSANDDGSIKSYLTGDLKEDLK